MVKYIKKKDEFYTQLGDNPDQFELIGHSSELAGPIVIGSKRKQNPGRFYLNGKRMYDRIAIRRK